MDVTTPAGQTCSVRRPWLPGRQHLPLDAELVVTALACVELATRVVVALPLLLLRLSGLLPYVVEVRDPDAPREERVVRREQVRGRRPARERVREVAHELAHA